jgi:hypothetical protein
VRWLVLFCATLLVLACAGVAQATPSLRPLQETPLVVRGTGFQALERITVRAFRRGGDPLVRLTTASRTGTFTVRLPIALDPCAGISLVRARGALGSRARLLVTPLRRPCVAPVVPG